MCCYAQDQQDIQLEDERDKLLTKRAILIQKVVRGFLIRQRYTKMKSGSILIQKIWRGYHDRQKCIKVSYNTPCKGALMFPTPPPQKKKSVLRRMWNILVRESDVCWTYSHSICGTFYGQKLNFTLPGL